MPSYEYIGISVLSIFGFSMVIMFQWVVLYQHIPIVSTCYFFEMLTLAFFGQLVREDYLQLKQEATDLQEYSSAKLDRVTRYLGVLADKTRKLGKA